MGIKRVFAGVLPLILGLATLTGGQEEPSTPKGQQLQLEIKKLITELGDDSFQAREKAAKRLAEIGVPVLDALREAAEKGDAGTKRGARLLIERISAANPQPTLVNGMEFKLVTEKVWAVPQPGEKTIIKTGLQVTNTTDTVYRLNLRDAFKWAVLRDSTGKDLARRGGVRLKTTAASVSPPLKKNQSHTMTFEVRLILSADKLLFYCEDTFSQYWQSEGLSKGTYYFGLVYENKKPATDGGDPYWVGRAQTVFETVEIK